jgi:hypothetical protein
VIALAGTARSRGRKPSAREAALLERFEALVEALVSIGYEVTVSPTLEGRGGQCVVRGQRRVILSRRLPIVDRVDVLVDVLRSEDLDGTFLRPDIRQLVQAGENGRAEARATKGAAPEVEASHGASGGESPAAGKEVARARRAKRRPARRG